MEVYYSRWNSKVCRQLKVWCEFDLSIKTTVYYVVQIHIPSARAHEADQRDITKDP